MKTIVITGASSGIGAVAARVLAEQGWDVAVVGRNPLRTHQIAASVGGTAFVADFDSLGQVRELAAALLERYPRIDVLANNAGGLISRHGTSGDGFERTIQHNHLAPFLLTNLLLPRLESSGARVIGTASVMNRFGRVRPHNLNRARLPYLGGAPAYATAKLATVLFARALAARASVTAYSFHPGFVATSFGHDSALSRGAIAVAAGQQITAEAGALPLIHLASGPQLHASNGEYFDGLYPGGKTGAGADDTALGASLWAASARAVGLG